MGKEPNCAGTVARIMVVCERQDLYAALVDFPQKLYPFQEVAPPIHDDLVPSLRFFLDALPVSKPANIGEVSSNQVESVFHLPRPGHPSLVNQRQSDAVLSQQIHKAEIEPILVPNLDCEFVALWQFLQKRFQECQEFGPALEF